MSRHGARQRKKSGNTGPTSRTNEGRPKDFPRSAIPSEEFPSALTQQAVHAFRPVTLAYTASKPLLPLASSLPFNTVFELPASCGTELVDDRLKEARSTVDGLPDGLLVVVYEAPWDALDNPLLVPAQGYLGNWLHTASALLRLKQESPDRVLLLNVRRLADSYLALAEALGFYGVEDTVVPTEATNDHLRIYRARNFEWWGAEYWDSYEALESCAWLGNCQPEYRAQFSIDGLEMGDIVDMWQAVPQVQELRQRERALEQALQAATLQVCEREFELQSENQQLKAEAVQSAKELNGRIGELEKMLAVLESQLASARDLENRREQELTRQMAAQNVLREELEQSHTRITELETTTRTAAGAAVEAKARLSSLEAECAAALKRNTQLDSELVRMRALVERTQLESAKWVHERTALERVHKEAMAALEKKQKETASESGLLALQLSQVQEELEHYFSKSRDATSALQQSTESFRRARSLVLRLMRERCE